MEKKLPSVYANKIEKQVSNNERVAYSKTNEERNSEMLENSTTTNMAVNINQKLNSIFNSPRYVYKAEVEITLKDKIIVKKIIGQNQNYLITLENELIPISEIIDIDFAK